jgi:hypothetical protein
VDGRSCAARRWRDLFRDYSQQTGGRHDQLCRSLASLVVRREQVDVALVSGGPVDTDELLRLCGAINRTMAKLGLVVDDDEPSADPTVPKPNWLLSEVAR